MAERVRFLAVGDELLDGRVADTHSPLLARALASVGLALERTEHLPDDQGVLAAAFARTAAEGCQLAVVSGGLGPTVDDLTREAMAQAMGVPLVRDPAVVAGLEARAARRGRPATPNQLRQADRPQGAELLPNPVGTAPAFRLGLGGCTFVCLPGVPAEFARLVEDVLVAPRRGRGPAMARQRLWVVGVAESEVDHRVQAAVAPWPGVGVQLRVDFPCTEVILRAPAAAAEGLAAAAVAAQAALGPAALRGEAPSLAAAVAERLAGRGLTLAVAESLTGGLVADRLTDVSGASAWLAGGVVAYTNAAKVALLGVEEGLLAAAGAASAACAAAMAVGARERLGAAVGLALTGAADPPGRAWLGLAWAGRPPTTWAVELPSGERRRNKLWAAHLAMLGLWQALGEGAA